MIPRDKEILEDTWASKNYFYVPRKYIDPAFLDGVLLEDESNKCLICNYMSKVTKDVLRSASH